MPLDKAALSDRAWEMLTEALTSGTMTMADGTRLQLRPTDMVAITKWLASLDATKKRKVIDLPEDLRQLLSPSP
jgi:hypothetical protein